MLGREIEILVSRLLSRTRTCFLGVYPRNQIPRIVRNSHISFCFIANTDSSLGTGKHWVAFHVEANGFCEFFDSLGASPSSYGFILSVPVHCVFTSPIQSRKSFLCGQFCILYLYLRSKDKNIKDYLSDHTLLENELRLSRFLERVMEQ